MLTLESTPDGGIARVRIGSTVIFDASKFPGVYPKVVHYLRNGVPRGDRFEQQPAPTVAGTIYTFTYDWGTISVGFTAVSDRLIALVNVQNKSATDTISDVVVAALSLSVSLKNLDMNPHCLFGGSPDAVWCDLGVATAAVYSAVPWHRGYTGMFADGNGWAMMTANGVWGTPPTSWPVLHKDIPPLGSDTFGVVAQFGPPEATEQILLSEMHTNFAANRPSELAWYDRRPIINMFPAGSPSDRPIEWKTNPRGWFNQPKLDVTTPVGVADFKLRLTRYAQRGVAIAQAVNAQGAIWWDLCGGEPDPALNYLGDPAKSELFAPELEGVLDECFLILRRAGLRSGVCVRPQRVVRMANGGWTQQIVSDWVPVLAEKITYAQQRWGCTLFYVDSNDWSDNPDDWRRLHRMFPGILLIPENQNPGMYAVAAPYDSYAAGPTPANVRAVWPDAFTVRDLGSVVLKADQAKQMKAEGDVPLIHGWYRDENFAPVRGAWADGG